MSGPRAPYDLVIVDLDGVVYLGTEAVPQAAESIRSLVDGGGAVMFVTNNASRRADEVAALLRSLDVPARPEDVLTAAAAAAELLAAELPAGAPVLVVGAPALATEIGAVGLRPVTTAGAEPVAVVQGYGPDVGWADLAEATVAIRGGARWVATNTDATMPSPRGPLPGNGSLVAALGTALDRTPDVVVGKPEPALFRLAAAHRGATRCLVVGDRLDTDIRGAARAGMASLLVLTGVSTPADLLRSADRPTYLAPDLTGLAALADHVIPQWMDGVTVDGWTVRFDGALVLAGAGPDDAALRALASAAWANPGWTGITAAGEPAGRAVAALGLRAACAA